MDTMAYNEGVIKNWIESKASLANNPLLMSKFFILHNWQWIGLAVVVIFGVVFSAILGTLSSIVLRRLLSQLPDRDAFQQAGDTSFLGRPISLIFLGWFWLGGVLWLSFSDTLGSILLTGSKVLTLLGIVWTAWRVADLFGELMLRWAARTDTRMDDLFAPLITRSIKVLIVIFGGITLAESLNLPISSLLAGLGIGGIAIAMAAKDTIANFFGSLTVLVDRPFHIGDWVVIGNLEGSVEKVGFRSTRVRTFYNSLISIPNATLLTTSVDNMGARRYRRIKCYLSLTYDTSPDKIEAFCEGVREIIRENPHTRKDYFHVYFNRFSSSSLDILLYCFLETPDWGVELQEKHRLFLDITKLARSLDVSFAFPTQTLHIAKDCIEGDPASPPVPA